MPDVAIAAPFAGKLGRNDNGTVSVVFGPRTGGTINLDALGTGGFRIDGPGGNEFIGETGIAMGDVSGDGNDKINSLDGRKGEQVNCGGAKKDGVTANKGDKVNKNCERVKKK